MTLNCWVPFVFLIGKQTSTKYTLFTAPRGDLKKTSRTEKGHGEHTLALGNF